MFKVLLHYSCFLGRHLPNSLIMSSKWIPMTWKGKDSVYVNEDAWFGDEGLVEFKVSQIIDVSILSITKTNR